MAKCPMCNSTMPKKKVSAKLKNLMLSVSPKLTSNIEKLFNLVSDKWNLKDTDKCAFFVKIENVDENIVMKMIQVFINKGYADRGYNIPYLCGMIEKEYKQQKFKNEYERKRLDRIPPKLKD
tara:strand:- start:250 stop:615 length:366 start_codon:yes stop_codon:yes gene_type:complete